MWPSLRRSELHAKTGNMELMDGTLKDGSEQAALEAKLAVVKAANGNIISAKVMGDDAFQCEVLFDDGEKKSDFLCEER